jgi:hypothetical protein
MLRHATRSVPRTLATPRHATRSEPSFSPSAASLRGIKPHSRARRVICADDNRPEIDRNPRQTASDVRSCRIGRAIELRSPRGRSFLRCSLVLRGRRSKIIFEDQVSVVKHCAVCIALGHPLINYSSTSVRTHPARNNFCIAGITNKRLSHQDTPHDRPWSSFFLHNISTVLEL